MSDDVLSELIRLQLFKFTPAEELNYAFEALKRNFTKWSILDADDEPRHRIESSNNAFVGTILLPDRRIYFADAEGLAEQGVCDFLKTINGLLVQEGVQMESLHDEAMWDEQSRYIYYVNVNGTWYRIIDESQDEKNAWCLAHKRTVEIINMLLEATGSLERAYGQASGSSAQIAILSNSLYDYIHSLPLLPSALPTRTEEMQCKK